MTAGVVLAFDDDRAARDVFEHRLVDDGYDFQLADSEQFGLALAVGR